jgi:cytochrome b subunit of formate dehydrogenase
MRHRLLPAATALLWIINVSYVAITHGWPHVGNYDSGQRLLLCATLAITLAWLLDRSGIEYRIGYRHGRNDRPERPEKPER